MRYSGFGASVLLAVLALGMTSVEAAAQHSLTIYNDGRVLVRRTLPVAVPRGESTPLVEIGDLDPSTLFAIDPAVAINRATFDGGVDEQSVLRRSLGQQLRFVVSGNAARSGADTIMATIVGVDPLRFRLADGSITFSPPGRTLYPAEMVPLSPTLRLELTAARARESLALGYFTGGATWQAAYSMVLDAGQAAVSGHAAIASDRLLAREATVQLLAGNVGRANRPPMPYARAQMMEDAASKAVGEESVGEAHLYTLRRPLTLLPGETTLASLFDPVSVAYTREYFVRGGVPYWGYLQQTGDEGQVPVEILYTFPRKQGTAFGDVPLPGGVARLYEKDAAGQLQLTGEASTEHTAAGQDLRISAGSAFDITAKRVQTAYSQTQEGPRRNRTVAVADYTVTISNAKSEAVTVVVEERRGGDWSIVTSSIAPTRSSSTVARFRVPVAAGGETVLTYQVRASW